MIARPKTFLGIDFFEWDDFEEVKGAGDGTVPLLSSQRLSQYLPPGAPVWTIQGPNKQVEHTALMANANVLAAIDAFLANQPLPPPPPPSLV